MGRLIQPNGIPIKLCLSTRRMTLFNFSNRINYLVRNSSGDSNILAHHVSFLPQRKVFLHNKDGRFSCSSKKHRIQRH